MVIIHLSRLVASPLAFSRLGHTLRRIILHRDYPSPLSAMRLAAMVSIAHALRQDHKEVFLHEVSSHPAKLSGLHSSQVGGPYIPFPALVSHTLIVCQ